MQHPPTPRIISVRLVLGQKNVSVRPPFPMSVLDGYNSAVRFAAKKIRDEISAEIADDDDDDDEASDAAITRGRLRRLSSAAAAACQLPHQEEDVDVAGECNRAPRINSKSETRSEMQSIYVRTRFRPSE